MRINNREASEKLNVKLAKWKRWSREFLPPDPTAGMQSGYAREYSLDECFTVYLGGHLVSNLKLSIPDTKEILKELLPWLEAKRFLPLGRYKVQGPSWGIAISTYDGIAMVAKGTIEVKNVEGATDYDGPGAVYIERYISEHIGQGVFNPEIARNLSLSIFVEQFLDKIKR